MEELGAARLKEIQMPKTLHMCDVHMYMYMCMYMLHSPTEGYRKIRHFIFSVSNLSNGSSRS